MTASISTLEPLVPATQPAASGEMLAPLDADTGAGFSLGEVVRVSFDSLIANKTRSILTMLGVIIGVASVVALLSLGNGAQASITGQVQSIGTNLIFVIPGSANNRGPGGMAAAQNLTMDDVQAIGNLGLPLNGIAPQFSGNADIVAPAADKNATIIGTTPTNFALAGSAAYQWIPVRRRSKPRCGAGRSSGRDSGQRFVRQRHGGWPNGARQGSGAAGGRRAGR